MSISQLSSVWVVELGWLASQRPLQRVGRNGTVQCTLRVPRSYNPEQHETRENRIMLASPILVSNHIWHAYKKHRHPYNRLTPIIWRHIATSPNQIKCTSCSNWGCQRPRQTYCILGQCPYIAASPGQTNEPVVQISRCRYSVYIYSIYMLLLAQVKRTYLGDMPVQYIYCQLLAGQVKRVYIYIQQLTVRRGYIH